MTCSKQNSMLVAPKMRFTRQLVYSMLRAAAPAVKNDTHTTLADVRFAAWAGAFRSRATYQDSEWRWRGGGEVFVANSTASGWLEVAPGGAAGASAWHELMWQVADAPESVSVVGRVAGAANGSATCASGKSVDPALLYPWPADNTTMWPCACEMSGANPLQLVVEEASCHIFC